MAIDTSNIDAPSLPEYFRALIRDALEQQGSHRAPESVEFYLVNLLQQGLNTGRIYGRQTEGFREEPLALLYIRAVQAGTEARVDLLKRLGDVSLFISGFFPESLTRRLVDVAYYIQMGETAYGSLSQILDRRERRSALAEIFDELANHFMTYVDILSEVSTRSAIQRDADLLRLYESWMKTGSERAAKLLARQGILPIPHSLQKRMPN